jgi:hypothetical protein
MKVKRANRLMSIIDEIWVIQIKANIYNGHIQFLQTLDSLNFTCFTYSKGLKFLTLLIIAFNLHSFNIRQNIKHAGV